jgi:predicted phosphohydrolase
VKLLVAGNHDIWSTSSYDSLQLYTRIIPEIASQHGFYYLDDKPYVLGDVGFAGSILWYDYSFRQPELNIPMQAYERKFFQGYLWYDVECIRWDLDDKTFSRYQYSKMENHLSHLHCKVDSIVVITHHVPFRNMIRIKNKIDWDFGNAFQGSEIFGSLLLKYEKIKYLVCGHSHLHGEFQNGHIQCFYVGSSYRKKDYVLIEL